MNLEQSNHQMVTFQASLVNYKAIQAYSSKAMLTDDFDILLDLSIEAFSNIFGFQDIIIFEYFDKDEMLYPIAYQGFLGLDSIPTIACSTKELNANIKGQDIFSNPKLSHQASKLLLKEGVFCPMRKSKNQFYGLILLGNSDVTSKNLTPSELDVFTDLSNQVSFFINNFRANEDLRLEIVERKIIEQKIEEQAAQLKRSNEDLQQFAYVISHDLKAPLRNITSFAQLLEHSFVKEIPEDALEYLHFILKGVKQLSSLIDDLLIYSRASEKQIEFEPVEFDLVMETVKYNLNISIQETDTIINYKNLPTLDASFNQMALLFQNLIGNAVKFRQENITPIINIESKKYDDKHTLFTVSDNGIGVKSEYFNRIFSLFQRLHRQDEYEGTGLGLSICKRIMERHQGKIWVESNGANCGTTFFVLIPE